MNEAEVLWAIVKLLSVAVPVTTGIIAIRAYDQRRCREAHEKIWTKMNALSDSCATFLAREEIERKMERLVTEIKHHVTETFEAHERVEAVQLNSIRDSIVALDKRVQNGVKNGGGR